MAGEDDRTDDELDDATRLPDEWETRLPGDAETRLPGEEATRFVREPETLPPLPDDDGVPADPITVLPLADDVDPAEPETVLPLPDSVAPGVAKERVLDTAYGESAVTHDVDPAEVLAAIDSGSRPSTAQKAGPAGGGGRGPLLVVGALLVVAALAVGGWFVFGRGGGGDEPPPADPSTGTTGDAPPDTPPDRTDPPVVPPAATTGGLAVASEPADATVLVDGKEVGVTPLSLEDLAPGDHDVRLTLPFHEPWTLRATVRAGEETPVTAKLARGTATLSVHGGRPGAAVALTRQGEPPRHYLEQLDADGALRDFAVEAGAYVFEATLDGHAPDRRTVRLETGAALTVDVDLAPLEAVLSVTSFPIGATVLLGERELGETPLTDVGVPVGTYRLRLTAPEHEPLEQEITIRAGEPLRLDGLRLPAWPRLDVSALDPGVTVFRDGVELKPAQRLPPGTFAVELRQAGYAPQTVTVTAEVGANLKVTARDWSAFQAELDVSGVGDDVTVLLGGEELFGSKTFPAATRVSVRLTRDGYADQVHEVDLALGAPHRLAARPWEPLLGTVELDLGPGVVATIDGKTLTSGDRLSPGRYGVTFARDGFLPLAREIVVEAGAAVRVRAPAADAWQRVPLTAEERVALLADRARWNAATDGERAQVLEAVGAANEGYTFVDVRPYTSGGVTNVVARFRHAETGLVFALLPGGTFQIGRAGLANAPPGTVTLSRPFLVCTTEVPQRVWKAVVGDEPSESAGDELPVESIDWYEATKFCARFEWALPTEAQWEYAASAGTTSLFSFGDAPAAADEHAWHFGNSGPRTHDVGTRSPNAFGLFDVHGNVREWCRDVLAAYPAAPRTDPAGPEPPGNRVVRGGGCRSEVANLATARREGEEPRARSPSLGFRPVAPVVVR